jgi:hypothetical protein
MAKSSFSGPIFSSGGFTPGADSLITLAATATLDPDVHAGRTLLLSLATGFTLTLPPAIGTGHVYRFFVATTITSNNYIIKVADATDVMAGVCITANDTDASASLFETAASSDTITLNGTSTGGIIGGQIELQDMATNLWRVMIVQAATAAEATPFSATV